MLNKSNKSFGAQFIDYVGNPKEILGNVPGVVAAVIPIIITAFLAGVGRGVLPGGSQVFHWGVLVLTGVLIFSAILALGDESHKQGNEDIAPTFAFAAVVVSLALALLTFWKDTGHFAGVLGG